MFLFLQLFFRSAHEVVLNALNLVYAWFCTNWPIFRSPLVFDTHKGTFLIIYAEFGTRCALFECFQNRCHSRSWFQKEAYSRSKKQNRREQKVSRLLNYFLYLKGFQSRFRLLRSWLNLNLSLHIILKTCRAQWYNLREQLFLWQMQIQSFKSFFKVW